MHSLEVFIYIYAIDNYMGMIIIHPLIYSFLTTGTLFELVASFGNADRRHGKSLTFATNWLKIVATGIHQHTNRI